MTATQHAKSVNKIHNLTALESRLQAASVRAEQAGYLQRAAAYQQQAAAVRREKERWTLLASTPPAPSAGPHLLASILVILLSLLDLSCVTGHAAKRLARAVLTIGIVVCAIVLGTSPASAWRDAQQSEPVPWMREFAVKEYLITDSERRKAGYLSPRALLEARRSLNY